MSALSMLEDKMNSDKYFLTELIHKSTKESKFGYKGYMITYYFWYKLRVYYCYSTPENVTISKPDIYKFDSKEQALTKLRELKAR